MNKFSISNYTKRNKFTRMCIGEAMVSLMKEKSYSKIKILDLAVKAGVSRMTFYKYYHTKEEVLGDYLNEIISGYVDIYDIHLVIFQAITICLMLLYTSINMPTFSWGLPMPGCILC